MAFEVEDMDVHFNKCAPDYDRNFYEDIGMSEFYDEIERQIISCGEPKNILVLGCGTGLEIERIKHSSNVTAIDISPGMLEQLKQKSLAQVVALNTICGSYFDIPFAENSFDLVLSTYSFHHFKLEQKSKLYKKIYNSLKLGGAFINGDTVCNDKATEISILNHAEDFYEKQQLPFGTIHIDVPLALDTEITLISDAGFKSISLEKRWTKTALIKAVK